MNCVRCFFSNTFQRELKERSFGEARFENTLKKYKEIYINELSELINSSQCQCTKDSNLSEEYLTFLNDFLQDLKQNISEIESYFDEIISIYESYITKNRHIAFSLMKGFLENRSTNYTSRNSIQCINLMFRGRPKASDDKSMYDQYNIKEYFHIPFDKRNLMGNQRFSVSGQPMIYFATSLPIALKELEGSIQNVSLAVFLLDFSKFYNNGVYDITNSIDSTINDVVINLMRGGSKIEYNNDIFTFSKRNLLKLIADSILYQILTFPTQKQGSFKEEYILPQLMTEIIQERAINKDLGYKGICYQSTKKPESCNLFSFRQHLEDNFCFFIPYEEQNNYSMEFMDNFIGVCLEEDVASKTIDDVEELLIKYTELKDRFNKEYNMNDFIIYLVTITSHIEAMKKIAINGITYYQTYEGIYEASLIYRLLQKIMHKMEKEVYNGEIVRKIKILH